MIIGGIDGGGSSCKCMLMNEHGEVLATVKTGGCNFRTRGIAKARVEINKAISLALKQAQIKKIDILGVGLAGVGYRQDLELVKKEILPLKNVEKTFITEDGIIALWGALANDAGTVLISGTGSVAYRRNKEGQIIKKGGWGFLLGDEGSGFALGLQMIKAAIRAEEDRGKSTKLTALIKQHFNIKELAELFPLIYNQEIPVAMIAALAKLLFTVYDEDDVAKKIVDQEANELVDLIQSVAVPCENLILLGGILLQTRMKEILSSKLTAYKIQQPQHSALEGAVLWGAHLGGFSFKI